MNSEEECFPSGRLPDNHPIRKYIVCYFPRYVYSRLPVLQRQPGIHGISAITVFPLDSAVLGITVISTSRYLFIQKF